MNERLSSFGSHFALVQESVITRPAESDSLDGLFGCGWDGTRCRDSQCIPDKLSDAVSSGCDWMSGVHSLKPRGINLASWVSVSST